MRYLKLFIISVIVFSILLFCLSLVFPSTTYVSRAVNVKGDKQTFTSKIPELHFIAFENNRFKEGEFIRSEVKVSSKQVSDTLLTNTPFSSDVKQGLAVYTAGDDSTTVQVFYKIHVPFYKPWKKFALMLNETKYGPSLDSAISRISRQF